MRDLKSFYVRANTCVACHQNIDADLTAAGHPDLIFELDANPSPSQNTGAIPEGSGPRAWLVGQAVALRETSWKLARNPDGNEQTLAQWHGLAWLLAKVTATEGSLPRIEPPVGRDAAASRAPNNKPTRSRATPPNKTSTPRSRVVSSITSPRQPMK